MVRELIMQVLPHGESILIIDRVYKVDDISKDQLKL